jgi:hypothetical protein
MVWFLHVLLPTVLMVPLEKLGCKHTAATIMGQSIGKCRGNAHIISQMLTETLLQADHPLLWSSEQRAWLEGSPMQKKLNQRWQQIQEVRILQSWCSAGEATSGPRRHNLWHDVTMSYVSR